MRITEDYIQARVAQLGKKSTKSPQASPAGEDILAQIEDLKAQLEDLILTARLLGTPLDEYEEARKLLGMGY